MLQKKKKPATEKSEAGIFLLLKSYKALLSQILRYKQLYYPTEPDISFALIFATN